MSTLKPEGSSLCKASFLLYREERSARRVSHPADATTPNERRGRRLSHLQVCARRCSALVTMPKDIMTTRDVDILEEAHKKEAACASWWREQYDANQVR